MDEFGNEIAEHDDKKLNNYERVIIAARRARQINSHRQAEKEQLAAEELAKLDQKKVTSIALEEVETGNVVFERARKESEEETYDLT